MKNLIQKREFRVLAVAAVLALALGWYFMGREPGQVQTAGKSHAEAVLEGYTAWTEREQYHTGTSKITISVRNDGETMHEFDHPVLERQQDGIWYSLQKGEEIPTTANLLYIEPGETKEFDCWTQSYGKLYPGRYRVLFLAWESFDYIAAEFDVV